MTQLRLARTPLCAPCSPAVDGDTHPSLSLEPSGPSPPAGAPLDLLGLPALWLRLVRGAPRRALCVSP